MAPAETRGDKVRVFTPAEIAVNAPLEPLCFQRRWLSFLTRSHLRMIVPVVQVFGVRRRPRVVSHVCRHPSAGASCPRCAGPEGGLGVAFRAYRIP